MQVNVRVQRIVLLALIAVVVNTVQKMVAHAVFADFVELSVYAIANRIYQSEELEQNYMRCANKYSSEELVDFAKLLAVTFDALTINPAQDFLGHMFEMNELGNARAGQFFTPYTVAAMMAQILVGDTIPEKGYVTLSEPCSGSGCMIIAFADAMRMKGFDPCAELIVVADDIDPLCFHMCYVQLSILGIPALVRHHDTIKVETYRSLMTPSLANQFDKFESFFNEDSTNTRRALDEDSQTKYKYKEKDKRNSITVVDENHDAAHHETHSIILEDAAKKGKARVGQYGLF